MLTHPHATAFRFSHGDIFRNLYASTRILANATACPMLTHRFARRQERASTLQMLETTKHVGKALQMLEASKKCWEALEMLEASKNVGRPYNRWRPFKKGGGPTNGKYPVFSPPIVIRSFSRMLSSRITVKSSSPRTSIIHPLTFIIHPRTFITHPHTFTTHPRTFITHPHTFIAHH
jgi:hypothetical protein